MVNKYYNISVYILVIIYVGLNIAYKKYFNIFLFASLFGIINILIKNCLNSIIIAYIISITFGIYKNFHLIENFKSKDENKDFNISNDNNLVRKVKPKTKPNKKEIQYNKIKQDIVLRDIDIKELISDELLTKFIDFLKTSNVSIIYNKLIDIYTLKPTIKNLNINKVKTMTSNFDNSIEKNKPIVISKDKFIIDGHHRWYSKKNIIDETNPKKVNSNISKISVTIIDLPINNIINKVKDFKSKYNNQIINNFNIDKSRLNDTQKCIDVIKSNITRLESFYEDFNEIKII